MATSKDIKQQTLDCFQKHMQEFVGSTRIKVFRSSIAEMYAAKAGDQWTSDDKQRRTFRKQPMITVNRMAPLIRAIAGHAIVNREKADLFPRRFGDMANEQQADVMADAVEYVVDDCDFYYESSQASEDELTCGIGATDTGINYMNPDAPYGECDFGRIFPGYLLFDPHASMKNMKDGMWRGYFEIVSRDYMIDEVESATGKPYVGEQMTSGDWRAELLTPFKNFQFNENYGIIYHYQYKKREALWKAENPFSDEWLQANPEAAQIVESYKQEEEATDLTTSTISMDKKQYALFKGMIKTLDELYGFGLEGEIKYTKSEVLRCYRARIAENVVLEADYNFTQDFSIKFKTLFYDEQQGVYYGLGRDVLPVQRALNEGVSDFVSYLRAVPKGGMNIEKDAVENFEEFVRTRANEQDVTIFKSGALNANKVQPKQVPGQIPGLNDFITYMQDQIPGVIGIDPSFFAAVESGNMTSSLFGKLIKQAYNVLAPFFDGERSYLRDQTKVFMDVVRVLAENNSGMMLRRVSVSAGDENFALTQDGLAKEYDIAIAERPITQDEQLELANKMSELATVAAQFGKDLTPLVVKYLPLPSRDKQDVDKLMNPPPPPPDPINQELLAAEAAKSRATEQKTLIEARLKEVELQKEIMLLNQQLKREMEEITEINSRSTLNYAKAGQANNPPPSQPGAVN